MNETKIREQISVIQKATEKASKSKDSATKFLQDAGIKKASTATKKS